MLNICLLELFQFIRNNQLEQIVIQVQIIIWRKFLLELKYTIQYYEIVSFKQL